MSDIGSMPGSSDVDEVDMTSTKQLTPAAPEAEPRSATTTQLTPAEEYNTTTTTAQQKGVKNESSTKFRAFNDVAKRDIYQQYEAEAEADSAMATKAEAEPYVPMLF